MKFLFNSLLFLSVNFLVLACSSTRHKNNISFTQSEINLIMLGDSTIPMRVFKINNKSDSLLLRTISSNVKANPNDPILQHFVNRLYRTVRDSMSLGIGIAAPQVGVLKNIIWVQRFDKEEFPFEVYLNPKITQYSTQKQTYTEGCLSIPNRSETLNNRSYEIVIEYDTMENTHKTESIEGFTSVIFQHEIDHLYGILYLDHLEKDVIDSE
ncbi:peptide deformylase [Formosa maritima]|uniref:Peptide deformylase n=1 Tax=Formosa maritima TaxID=2592046 RepID=A0A5D0GJR5_9FLAO|nr:peptide deformylase [Formosa maritima]TYA59096.1 peptide deformylase [Formosa maritima]